MELVTERLKIVACTMEVLSCFPNYKLGPHISSYLEQLEDDTTLLGWGVWLVMKQENNTIIGDIGFKGKPNEQQTIEVGYGIVPSEQGNGYATEAVAAIIEWACSSKKVRTITAQCQRENIPSNKVLMKLGFQHIKSENDMLKWALGVQQL
ncbi:GNAT family N-acetyltransferase [Gracilibacillus sp. S3-1-1]|uniref:GNAT family N-acetyltransferase n=1 Tax=Gracilibacillus pellucidus TaxID=3095368 RepID=A0ACC6M527_9BACI|nr:GNAT family N-acetyltransferase [Gracilibacillus sp. S3-1-1]MDX8045867.1 GNAT family N-acetyltransferase [Gracilibacillus sp. S3-1-1]